MTSIPSLLLWTATISLLILYPQAEAANKSAILFLSQDATSSCLGFSKQTINKGLTLRCRMVVIVGRGNHEDLTHL